MKTPSGWRRGAPDPGFDHIVEPVSGTCDGSVPLVGLVDRDRAWSEARSTSW